MLINNAQQFSRGSKSFLQDWSRGKLSGAFKIKKILIRK